MGNPTSKTSLSDFDSTPYIKQGITENEVIEIKSNFERMGPIHGFVKVDHIKEQYKNTFLKDEMDRILGEKEYVNFDEFYGIMAAEMVYARSHFKNVEFDNYEAESGCILCGSNVDRRQKNYRFQ